MEGKQHIDLWKQCTYKQQSNFSCPFLIIKVTCRWLAVYEPHRPDVIEEEIKFSEPLQFYKQQMERTLINSKV